MSDDTPRTAPLSEPAPIAPIAPESARVVYLVGASFESCPLSWACDGPRTSQYLGALLSANGDVLVHDGRPGEYHEDQLAAVQWRAAFHLRTGTEHERADVAVLGLANDALRDGPAQSLASLDTAAALVGALFELADAVIVLDYPLMAGRHLPGLTEGLEIDPYWWDQVFRPAYRARMQDAGALVIDAYADWWPSQAERPGSPYPDNHLSTESAYRAAVRIQEAL
jgi:hypothetical protein